MLAILGSPSSTSRSEALARGVTEALALHEPQWLRLRELPAQALLHADASAPALQAALASVHAASVVLVATPIYKAAYSGLLKTFLDLLPPDALRDKTVLPLATGGSAAHLLAVDYALKPVLAALGARDILDAIYATDAQLLRAADGSYRVDADIRARSERAAATVAQRLPVWRTATPRITVAEIAAQAEPALALRCPA
ncbi:FMN reductase [Rivibacter subsaxonicus]|uniref:FMN reductase n=1 Tax=Rivibacter subsaxonicus TaxID=457575 RepID=A0A4Q7VWW7_9BURK|nr:FMN reductase [Rivibacter subsaxonicus]